MGLRYAWSIWYSNFIDFDDAEGAAGLSLAAGAFGMKYHQMQLAEDLQI